ncbi:MAG: trehalose-phosphatase [Acidimicrobiales bacterium]
MPAAFAPLLAEPSRSGIFTDFDGTLAPIVDDPAAARPLDGARAVLEALAAPMGRVAVISGRPARYLLGHLGGAGLSLWGLYGMEHAEDDRIVPVPEAEQWRAAVADTVGRARHDLGDRVNVEDKGITLTLHFRTAPEHAAVTEEWARRTADETGLVVHPARMSYELRPPMPHGKGAVLERLARDLGAACFFGDDHGDLDAFDALDRLAAAGAATVRVGVHTEESPDELIARADVTVEGPEGVLRILSALRDGVA